jgi:ABC-type bacteriocin/lantibiotic exporter with double-glycine peptidase domain
MMTTAHILTILKESTLWLKLDLDQEKLRMVESNLRDYDAADLPEFKRDVMESGRSVGLLVLEHAVPEAELTDFIKESNEPLLLFRREGTQILPELIVSEKKAFRTLLSGGKMERCSDTPWLTDGHGSITVMVMMPYRGVVSEYGSDEGQKFPPVRRLFRMLKTERKDIGYVLIYALIIGLLSLVLPLGLQTTVELISGGVFFTSVYVLIGLVILGVLVTGILQIVQISMVEQIQRRIFVKAAFEFAFRIPRIRVEALAKSYVPELVNRFFDITTLQKSLPKLLLDLSSAAIQVFFSLLLLSLYHPFFVFFSLFLVMVLALMFYITGPRGLQSSLNESKYKYKVVQWLEELARAIKSFKLAGNTDLALRKTDQAAGNYLKYRKTHFGVLLTQFSFFVFFKVAVTGGLLIMGAILVVDRQITLGQFVASEVIIVMVLAAVEKLILYVDVVYDMLTAVDKVAHVTDLPIEKSGGFDFPPRMLGRGYNVSLRNLCYKFADRAEPVLNGISLDIAPGERVCLTGPGGGGKTTFTNILAGLYSDYTGGVAINGISMRDLDISHLRGKIAKNISPDDIFDGTIYENLTIGRPTARVEDVINVVHRVGLADFINTCPEGLNTPLVSGGKGLSSSTNHRLILGRCLAKNPELIILNDFFSGLSKSTKLELLGCVVDPKVTATLVAVSNDPLVMAACNRVIVLDKGEIVADGSYEYLTQEGIISKYFE